MILTTLRRIYNIKQIFLFIIFIKLFFTEELRFITKVSKNVGRKFGHYINGLMNTYQSLNPEKLVKLQLYSTRSDYVYFNVHVVINFILLVLIMYHYVSLIARRICN